MNEFNTFDVRVAGTSFGGRQEYLKRLSGNEPCWIEPEPTNKFDPNALAVYVMFDGEKLHIGYVPREAALVIAPHLEGENVMCESLEITGGFELNDGTLANYGARVRVRVPRTGKE